MADDQETDEPSFRTLKLPFLPASAIMNSPDHPSGSATPPLQTLASVPFKWEEQPGKPRPCTDIIPIPKPATRYLDPPPPCRIMSMDRMTKTPSPTAVLDGPYDVTRPRFSSFRLFKEAHDSFYSSGSSSSSAVSPESGDVKLLSDGRKKGGGYFGKFRGWRKEVYGGSSRFTSSFSGASWFEGVKVEKKVRSQGSFTGVSYHPRSTTHIWGMAGQLGNLNVTATFKRKMPKK